MRPARLVVIIAAGEAFMGIAAIAAARLLDLRLEAGNPIGGSLLGLVAAALLAGLNLFLLRKVADRWPGTSLRHACRVIVRPLFEHTRVWHILVVSALAGVGEELLFRGVLQPAVGLAGASVLFGAVHVGGRDFMGYGIWAACIGAFFGWLADVTGGLVAPIVAHAVYDAVALSYVRYGSADICAE